MTQQAVQKDFETRMQAAVDALTREFAGVRTGRANAALLTCLTGGGYLPVVACVAGDRRGRIYNVNADQMAVACAAGLQADRLIFLTDVAGVKGADGVVIRWLAVREIAGMIREAVIAGGMLPKLEACESALRGGVNRVRILPADHAEGSDNA